MSLRMKSVALAVLVAGSAVAQRLEVGPVDLINQQRLRAHLEFVAHDLMEGRDTPSRGLDITAHYIATQLKLWGVEPAGMEGSYFQPFKLSRETLAREGTSLTIAGQTFAVGEGFLPRTLAKISTEAEVIMVPGGWSNTAKGVDPYKGLDINGKIVMTDGSLPEGVSARDAGRGSGWARPEQAAMEHGAVAVLYTTTQPGGEAWKRQADRMMAGGRYRPQMDAVAPAVLPSVTIGPDVAALLAGSALTASLSDSEAPKIALSLNVQVDEVMTQNVVAVIPGTDRTLSSEYIAIGSHYDHIGMTTNGRDGDTIFNGADDDGSGTVAMLEMAHALAMGKRPKRSTLFVWHAGEEKGLWGSQYYCANPTVPLDKIVIQLNIDMIGRSKAPGDTNPRNARLTANDEIFLIGPKIVSSDIDKMARSVNSRFQNLKLNDHHDRLDDPERIFSRSDHYSYIQKGVPAIFFFSGVHEDYHQVSDHVDKIDFDKLEKITKYICALVFNFSNDPSRPKIDGPVKSLPGFSGTPN